MNAKQLVRALAVACVVLAHNQSQAQIQYCPKTLCGTMNGSYYYFCEVCQVTPCGTTYVCTDGQHDPQSGDCPNCGMGCTPFTRDASKEKKRGDQQDCFEVHYDIKNFSNVPDMDPQDLDPNPFLKMNMNIKVNELDKPVKVTINGTDHYFRCFEVDNSQDPFFMNLHLPPHTQVVTTMRFGRRLKDGPPPHDFIESDPQAGGAGHFHHLKTRETKPRHFFVVSNKQLD